VNTTSQAAFREPFDNGRIRMEEYRGVLYCEAYMEDEFTVDDIQSMRDIIDRYFDGFVDIILKKVGNYSVSAEAQIRLSRGIREFRNFVYIADTKIKRDSALYATKTYMTNYNAKVSESKEEAYSMLLEQSLQNPGPNNA